MKLIHRFRIYILFVLVGSVLEAEIVQIKNIEECKAFIEPDMLVVFDIDNTLMEPVQTLGSDQWFSHRFNENLQRGLTKLEAFKVTLIEWDFIQLKTHVKLVEPITAQFVENLQNGSRKVLGLTTRGIEIAARTIDQLKSVDIDFAKAKLISQEFIFDGFPNTLYRDGIVFCSGMNKGELLFQFFEKSGYFPEKILLVDDKEDHLRKVEKICLEHQIPFIGLRYAFLDEKVQNLRIDLAEEQWKCFGNLINDEEAEAHLHISRMIQNQNFGDG